MKYFIASDIHGSAYYCEKMLDCYKKEKADRLLLLGDILYHGPRNDLPEGYSPKKVAAMLNEMKDEIFCVRGNCDAEIDQMVLSFPISADYAIISAGKNVIFATHGHLFNEEKLPPLKKGDVLLHGHTHVQRKVFFENYVYMNPGSVSLPKEDSRHGYMTFDEKEFKWKDLLSGEILTSCPYPVEL